jgi:hypothetical protein
LYDVGHALRPREAHFKLYCSKITFDDLVHEFNIIAKKGSWTS